MKKIDKSILDQLWVYCAALRTLNFLKLCDKYSEQVDVTINNIYLTSRMLLLEAKREYEEVKCQ